MHQPGSACSHPFGRAKTRLDTRRGEGIRACSHSFLDEGVRGRDGRNGGRSEREGESVRSGRRGREHIEAREEVSGGLCALLSQPPNLWLALITCQIPAYSPYRHACFRRPCRSHYPYPYRPRPPLSTPVWSDRSMTTSATYHCFARCTHQGPRGRGRRGSCVGSRYATAPPAARGRRSW